MINRKNDELDAKLLANGQQKVREVVQSLPEDTVSLSWRSELNERLLVEARGRRRKERVRWVMRPVAGLALAGAMALVVIFRTPSQAPAAPQLEAELMSYHEQATRYADVAGPGLSPIETAYGATRTRTASADWTEVDVESL